MSDSEDGSAQLSLELQQALEQAVGNVNDVAQDVANNHKKDKKKKKKRSREEREEHGEGEHVEDEEAVKKKHKKKKHRHDTDKDVEEPVVEEGVEEPVSLEKHKKKKKDKKEKKKKDKGKERAVDEPIPSDAPPATTSSEQPAVAPGTHDETTTTAFLNAVVAAASATSQAPSASQDYPPVPSSNYPLPYPPPPGHAGQYLPYPPPPGYPYPPPPDMYHQPHPQPFADLSGFGLPDPPTSEDLLRSLQELDVSKLTSVLRSLGDAANLSLSGPPSFVHNPAPPGPTPVRQVPVKSNAILGRSGTNSKSSDASGSRQRNAMQNPNLRDLPPPEDVNPEHAHMLANVWMNATKLTEMAKKQGLVYKKGKFSAIEEAQLKAAIENYRTAKGLSQEQLVELIFSKERGRDSFWSEITSALHLRPIIAVYHHVRRTYHPLSQQGRWMPSEDDALRKAVAEHGQQWEKISQIVGRMSSDCRDRYRNHIVGREIRNKGPWTKEEEEELTKIVTEMTIQQGKTDIDNDIFWGVVSQKMGGKRGRQQCRIKWTDSLSTQFKNKGQKPRWSAKDAYILVHKVDSLNVRDDSEIDWKKLPDENWNNWSAHALQRRWLSMKRGINGFEQMTHAEIMDILRTKKASSPPPDSTAKKKNKSAEIIDDSSDEESDTPLADAHASPSTGPSNTQ